MLRGEGSRTADRRETEKSAIFSERHHAAGSRSNDARILVRAGDALRTLPRGKDTGLTRFGFRRRRQAGKENGAGDVKDGGCNQSGIYRQDGPNSADTRGVRDVPSRAGSSQNHERASGGDNREERRGGSGCALSRSAEKGSRGRPVRFRGNVAEYSDGEFAPPRQRQRGGGDHGAECRGQHPALALALQPFSDVP